MTAATDTFLAKIKPLAIDGWITGKVLPSITGAQAILESAWGASLLTAQANNLFGIKASNWTGAIYTKQTLENKPDGTVYTVTADFRAYNNWDESVKDHTEFLQKDRYEPFRGLTDYKLAAQSIKDCGYATDVNYPGKLIKLIEAYGLDKWDTEAFNKEETTKTMGYVINDRRSSALGGQSWDRSRSAITTIGWHYSAVMRSVGKFITGHEEYWKNTLGWDRGGYHFYIDADANIWQNYDYERITWGVANNNGYVVHISVEAGSGTDYSPEQVAAREWLTRKIMADLNIPASNVKGHNEIYNNSSCPGYTKAQMDGFRAKLAKPATVENPNRVAVNYERRIVYGGYSIDSKPYGESGHEWWGNTTDFIGRVVKVVEENGTGEYLNTELGWIDKRALIEVSNRFPVAYDATITAGGYSVDSKPWGEDGLETWGNTTDLMYKTFFFYEENGSAEYANGQGLGWVDKRALTKGWISAPVEEAPIEDKLEPPVVEVVPEPVVSASILTLPDGEQWIVYPENGPYTAGDVITLVGGEYQILGDKGNNHLVVNLPNFGQVSILFDEAKGAAITKKYV